MSDDNYLLLAMESLADPIRSKVIQDGPVGSGLAGQRTVTVTLPCLLQQLNEAIAGTIGIGGSGSLPWTRNMLDADALHRFVTINATISSWARMVGAERNPERPWETLRAWYTAYQAKATDEARDTFYQRQMNGWAGQIRQKFTPFRVRDLPHACPLCEATSWFNPTDKQEYLRPLILRYRETGPDLIQQTEALCRACAEVWTVRELAYALEQQSDTPAENISS